MTVDEPLAAKIGKIWRENKQNTAQPSCDEARASKEPEQLSEDGEDSCIEETNSWADWIAALEKLPVDAGETEYWQ